MKINLSKLLKLKKPTKTVAADDGNFIIDDNTPFRVMESYKTARTNIMFSLPKSEKGKVVLITSSEPAEGKTTTSINLAYTFSQTGAKVILIDCDLRKPRIHRYLKIDRGIGMSNVLCGFSNLDQAIKKGVKGKLDCITSGEIPMNSAELLMSDVMDSILDELSSKYDYIFIDTPPVMTVTDAMILAPKCSGTVIVVRQETSTYDVIDKTVELMKQSGIKVLGFIFKLSPDSSKKLWAAKRNYRYSYKYLYNYRDDVNE